SQLGESDKLTDAERLSLKRDPLLSLFVNLVMKNGEKSKAEKIVNKTLFLIRQRTLSDPYLVLTSAVEKASPLMKTKSSKVGSKTVQVPRAISQRKRNRIGINWILTAAMKRKNRSASEKFANELIAIMNGESSVLAKKLELHKLILANRSNAI
ncbi:ribosomal protein S7, partial [Neoconidiobolus thromboides FSU 785]